MIHGEPNDDPAAHLASQADAIRIAVAAEPMMRYFQYDHLPPDLQRVSCRYHALACDLVVLADPGCQRTVALQRLLESKDAAVRAVLVSRA